MMNSKTDHRWYSVTEVAELLGRNPETIRRWLRDGRLNGQRTGGTKAGWWVRDDDVIRMLARRRHRPAV